MKLGKNNHSQSTGIGFFGCLLLIFVVLKLVGVVSWSWWLVLSPLWFPWVVLSLSVVAIVLTISLRELFYKLFLK